MGIRVVLEPSDDSFAEAVRPGTELTGLFAGWALDFADAENMIYPVVSPRSPDYFFPPWFTNEALLDEIDEALTVVGPGRPPAWREIDESLAEEAAFVPLYTGLQLPAALLGPGRLPGLPAAVQRPRRPRLALPALTGPAATLAVECPS